MSYTIHRVVGKKTYVHEDPDRGVIFYNNLDAAAYELCRLNDKEDDYAYCIFNEETQKRVDPSSVLMACVTCGYDGNQEEWDV